MEKRGCCTAQLTVHGGHIFPPQASWCVCKLCELACSFATSIPRHADWRQQAGGMAGADSRRTKVSTLSSSECSGSRGTHDCTDWCHATQHTANSSVTG